jgi:hypothetical protein
VEVDDDISSVSVSPKNVVVVCDAISSRVLEMLTTNDWKPSDQRK